MPRTAATKKTSAAKKPAVKKPVRKKPVSELFCGSCSGPIHDGECQPREISDRSFAFRVAKDVRDAAVATGLLRPSGPPPVTINGCHFESKAGPGTVDRDVLATIGKVADALTEANKALQWNGDAALELARLIGRATTQGPMLSVDSGGVTLAGGVTISGL